MALSREPVEYDGQHLPLPLPDGPGKALRLTVHPVREHDPDLPGRGRPEEPRADRRDRRRLAGDLLQPRARRQWLGRVRAGRRAGPGHGRWTAFDVVPTVPVVVGDDVERARRAGPRRTPRCTSAGWAAGSRTSTTRSPCGWATSEAAAEVQDLYLAREHAGRRGGGAVGVHRRDLADRAARADRRADRRTPSGRHHAVGRPLRRHLEEKLAALTAWRRPTSVRVLRT